MRATLYAFALVAVLGLGTSCAHKKHADGAACCAGKEVKGECCDKDKKTAACDHKDGKNCATKECPLNKTEKKKGKAKPTT